ncbi:SWI/SNF complex subunit SWI3C-like [Salvia divinorum]|uniref:SWI/SNF complex subunit SWI3C-like n=1 Tax=Salvia divinorum TaxID=28513 RepID=A0ABD1IEV0_SALDI
MFIRNLHVNRKRILTLTVLLERNYPSINATIVHDLFLQSATSCRRRLMRDSIWIAIMKWDSLLVTLALILLKRIPRKIMDGDSWSDQETLLLLEGMQLYNENWTKIAEHVGSKSKAQCILHFVRLPLDGAPLDNINVPSTSGSSNLSNDDDHGRSEPISNGICLEGEDTESKFPFSSSRNPVMSLVVFFASALGPRVAAACAHVSLGSLSKESSTEGSPGGYLSQHDAEGATLSAEKVISAAEDGLLKK